MQHYTAISATAELMSLDIDCFVCAGHVSTFTAGTVAHTAAERFAVLEEHDKFLRSSMLP